MKISQIIIAVTLVLTTFVSTKSIPKRNASSDEIKAGLYAEYKDL